MKTLRETIAGLTSATTKEITVEKAGVTVRDPRQMIGIWVGPDQVAYVDQPNVPAQRSIYYSGRRHEAVRRDADGVVIYRDLG